MIFLHAFFAFLATKRLVWIVREAHIFELGRRVLNSWGRTRSLLACPICVSVWCGGIATALFAWFPLGNWPFALSYAFEFWGMLEYAVNFHLDKNSSKLILRAIPGGTQAQLHNLKQEQAEVLVFSMADSWKKKK